MHSVKPIRSSVAGLRRVKGFTLMELMIVVTILGVILAIAYPAYTEQVRKARRADAVSSMMAAAQYLERCFTRYNQYDHASCTSPAGDSIDDYYDITIARDTTTFTITATPAGDQLKDKCGTMTLDYLGNKTPAPSGNRCWGQSS